MLVIRRIGNLSRFYIQPVASLSSQRNYSQDNDVITYKGGPGGRSSFNGVVATVFGATGFLGRYVVNRLARVGTQIVIPYRGDEMDVRHLRIMGDIGQIHFNKFHLKDMESIKKSVKYSSVVINLIGRDWSTRHFTLDETHSDGAASIAQAVAEANVAKTFIHVSALNADEESSSMFLQSKARGEKMARFWYPDATIIRPSTLYGDEDHFLNHYSYLRSLPIGIPLVDGGFSTKKRPVFVVDVAKAIVSCALTHKEAAGQTFELYGPTEHFLYDIIDYIFKVNMRPLQTYTISRKLLYALAWYLEMYKWIADPKMTPDLVYRQYMSDVVTPGLPGFEELDIQASRLEENAISILRRHRHYINFEEATDENNVCRTTASY